MNKKITQPNQKPTENKHYRPIKLPFQGSRKMDPGEWIYIHRAGLLVTVVVYLSIAILFISYKIMLKPAVAQNNSIVIDLEAEQPIPPTPADASSMDNSQMDYESARNRLSNQNAKDEGGATTSSRANSAALDQAQSEAERINQMLSQGRQAYDDGLSGIQSASSAAKKQHREQSQNQASQQNKGKGTKGERGRVAGNVVVSYDLPGRVDVYLHIPAYECQGGGQVVVDIIVNRNGKVVSASVGQLTNGAEECVSEQAVRAAKMSSFNVSSSAPDRQRGTITYLFVPQ